MNSPSLFSLDRLTNNYSVAHHENSYAVSLGLPKTLTLIEKSDWRASGITNRKERGETVHSTIAAFQSLILLDTPHSLSSRLVTER